MRRRFLIGRSTRGERNPMAKLTAEKVEEIRRRVAAGETKESIARELGVHGTAVGKAALGDRWVYGEKRR